MDVCNIVTQCFEIYVKFGLMSKIQDCLIVSTLIEIRTGNYFQNDVMPCISSSIASIGVAAVFLIISTRCLPLWAIRIIGVLEERKVRCQKHKSKPNAL